MSIPERGHTQETTNYSQLDSDLKKSVGNVTIPKRGHTQDATHCSRLETNFGKGVSYVHIPESGHTQESTEYSILETNFEKGVRRVYPKRGCIGRSSNKFRERTLFLRSTGRGPSQGTTGRLRSGTRVKGGVDSHTLSRNNQERLLQGVTRRQSLNRTNSKRWTTSVRLFNYIHCLLFQ